MPTDVDRCCDEPGCRRKLPIRLDRGGLSGRWYFITRWHVRSGAPDGSYVADEKHYVGEALQAVLDDAFPQSDD